MAEAKREIHWRPWGEEAFALSRKLGRPVLLDIGATWCHWCHVMEETTYSDDEVIRLVEEFYVPIKVDRDRNPEIDRRYQSLVGSVTGEGGWPLTAILTPEGDLITGGTYFPAKDGGGRPGLRRVLRDTANQWRTRSKTGGLDTYRLGTGEPKVPLSSDGEAQRKFLGSVSDSIETNFDELHGGFGLAPKFPHPFSVSLAFALEHSQHNERLGRIAWETLKHMADGGVHDQLGGGFHRYSVDAAWHIPHFEKLAIDQAFLLRNFLELHAVSHDEEALLVVRGIVGFCREVLSDSHPGLASSQDADRFPGDDGSYFTWTRRELAEHLTREELRVVQHRFGIDTDGTMPHDPDQNVLYRLFSNKEIAEAMGLSEEEVGRLLGSALQKMRGLRASRKVPAVDVTRYASVNGYLAGALALAGRVLGDTELVQAAEAAVGLFISPKIAQRGVPHEVSRDGDPRGWGILEDQASIAWGLLDLAEVTGKKSLLDSAHSLLEFISTKFTDSSGLLSDIAPDVFDGHIPSSAGQQRFPLEDTPLLSPNAAVALAWERFADLSGETGATDRAWKLFTAAIPHLEGTGFFASSMALAAHLHTIEPVKVTIVGDRARSQELLRSALETFHPRKVVLDGRAFDGMTLPPESEASLSQDSADAFAIICIGNRCLSPERDAVRLSESIRTAGRGAKDGKGPTLPG